MTFRKSLSSSVYAVLLLLLPSSALAADSASSGAAICFARVASNGALQSSGGKGTRTVTVSRDADGLYTVTCNGRYPPQGSAAKVVVNAAAEVTFASAAGNASSYSSTQIEIAVTTWQGSTQSDQNFTLLVYLGR